MAAGLRTSEDLVGREEQLQAFERVLDRYGPALVLVSGQVGSGKSRLVQEMSVRARARGWRTAPPEGRAALVITRDATPRSFARQIVELLAPRRDDTGPMLDAYALSREVAASSLPPPPAAAADRDTTAVMNAIREACPVLVAVDGFRPNAAFARWLTGQLIPVAQESGLPLVAVLTLETDPPPDVLRFAYEHFRLDRLDEAATERYFRGFGARLRPPMSGEELRTYVRAATERPELVHSLQLVLALAEPSER